MEQDIERPGQSAIKITPFITPHAHRDPLRRPRSGAAAGVIAMLLLIAGVVGLRHVWTAAAAGTISLTSLGSAYTQNFDTLVSTGTSSTVPAGWGFVESGTNANTTYTAGTGSSTTGDTYSFGSTGSTERAFGQLRSGSVSTILGASFVNNTGSTITSLAVAYTGEQWRAGVTNRNAADRMDFQYSTNATSLNDGAATWIDVNSLDFNSPNINTTAGALDGNAAANRSALSFTIGSLSISNGTTFFIRWTDFDIASSDDGLAIDDFSLTPAGASVLPNLTINDVSQNEGNSGTTTFTFTVSLSSPAGAGGVTFDIATADGTATAPGDYTAKSLTGQTIPAGSSTYTFDVLVNGDTAPETNETFFVNVTNVTGANATDGQGQGTIVNDDAAPNLTINDVSQNEGNSGTTTFTFTVSLSSPAPAGGVTFDIATANGTAIAPTDYTSKTLTGQTIPSGSSSYTFDVLVNGDTTIEPNETFFVNVTNVTNAIVTDGQGQGTIVNDDFTHIHDIQGSGTTSPRVGSVVTTQGVVTGVRSNGFFIQEPDASVDADPNSSEGIFVFTSSAPPAAAAVGNTVQVTGTVQEFIPSADPLSPPTTELAGSPTVTLISTGNPLPTPITLTTADTGTGGLNSGSIENLEKYEGMRVRVNSLTVVAPTQGSVSEANATSTSNGVFYGVLSGVARPFREPGIEANDLVPDGSGVTIPPVPRFDFNPERLRVNSVGLVGSSAIEVTAGATVSNLVGPLDYSFRTYTVLPEAATVPTVSGNISAVPVPIPSLTEFTIASFNMERFFDTTDDPSTSDVVLTTTAFNNRLNKASLAIRNVMRTPDIIGVEEMENLGTLQSVANKVNNDAVAAGNPNPSYVPYLVEGNDVGGIDVGFLVKTASVVGSTPRVAVNSVVQEGSTTLFANPDSSTSLLNDRPPLRLMAVVNNADGRSFPITVIVNHLRSLSGIDSNAAGTNGWATEGARVRAKRRAQAEFLANLIQARQMADPAEHIVSIGDYNAFQVNDGYVDSIGTIAGTPTPADEVVLASADLVNPDLIDLIDMVPADQRYSYSFDGDAQVIDHEIITGNLLAAFSHLAYARNDADFPETFRNDSTRPERISDHDMPVAYFTFPCAVACPANISRSNDFDRCGAIVNYPASSASSNCFPVMCSPSSGSFFPAGITTVTCAESPGNGASCSFTITVTDTQPPTITPPANVTQATDPNRCTAEVNFPAPVVTDNCSSGNRARRHSAAAALAPVCNPASGSTFSKGTTTVLCTVLDASVNQASCRFTVSVIDTHPPIFTSGCLADIYAAAAAQCPVATTQTLSYTYPAATDNCPGVVVTCNPPTGSTFPLGTTTVSCTAVDTSGNATRCSFQVNLFSLCLVDDSNPGNVVLFNAANGDYRYCCNGVPAASGRGALTVHGCVISIDDSKGNRRVRISADTSANGGLGAGSASIQRANSQICSITDKSMAGACTCN